MEGMKDSSSLALEYPDVVNIGEDGLVYMSEKHPELMMNVLNVGETTNNKEELTITM